jgi:hypothetical protein
MSKAVTLTDFERDVLISVAETALSGWETNEEWDSRRKAAAQRAVDKLRAADSEPERAK